MWSAVAPLQIEVHLTPADIAAALREDVRLGLTSDPKRIPPRWHYDERGGELFDRITQLEEYYPTRREREILEARAGEIAELSGADTLIELGAGSSAKTRLLLDALAAHGTLRRYAPFDVSEEVLRASGARLIAEYPQITVHGIVGDFHDHLGLLPQGGRRMIAFLGGTIGNLFPAERADLLQTIADGMQPGDSFLLGADLIKDRARLELAYDDPGGVTAAFSLNVLVRINRELGADFDVEQFRHDAVWDAANEWMELGLLSLRPQLVLVPELEIAAPFRQGEKFHTEISAKFRPDGIRAELAAAGLDTVRFWTDPAGDFALVLAAKPAQSGQ